MREIKFRAKNTINGQWVYGYYSVDRGRHNIYTDHTVYPAHPFSLGQFTGLHDKNGKAIYEGDIVECKMSFNGGFLPHMGEIVFLDKFGAFATKNQSGETLLHHHLLSSFVFLGNIHENPELL